MSFERAGSELFEQTFEFHPFTFDTTNLVLRRRGKLVKLGPQPRRLLRLLIAKRPHLVTHEEIRRSLWGDNPNVDAEAGIYACVARLRAALKDSEGEQRYIQTVSGETSGYCFVADVAEPREGHTGTHLAKAGSVPPDREPDFAFYRIQPATRAIPTGFRPTGKRVALLGASLVALLATTIAMWSVFGRDEHAPRRVTYTMLKLEGELDVTGPSLALAPNGRRLAYVTGDKGGGEGKLYIRDLSEASTRKIPRNWYARTPFFSGDGEWVGFREKDRLMKVASTGSDPIDLTPDRGFGSQGASWSVTGEIFFSRSSRGIWRVSEGEMPRPLVVPDPERDERTYKFPEMLPGEKSLLFTLGTVDITTWDDGKIMAVLLADGVPRVVVEGGSCARYSPSGHVVYARDGALYAVAFDVETLVATGAPIRVVDGVITNPVTGAAAFDISDDGTLVYAAGGSLAWDGRVVQLTREGEATPVTENLGQVISAKRSPDGARLLLDVTGATEQLWMYELDRGTFTRLTFAWDNFLSIWSPDGQTIAFWSSRFEPGIYWAPIQSVSDAKLLVPARYGTPSSFSPDAERIVYDDSETNAERDIWLLSLQGEPQPSPFLATSFDEYEATFSPDGRFLAYVSDESGRHEVYLRPAPDALLKWQVSADGGVRPQWAPNGSEIFFVTERHMMAVDVDLNGGVEVGKAKVLFPFPENLIYFNYTVAPDGRSFYVVERTEPPRPPTEVHLVLNWAEELKRLAPRD